jgi:hypothetical protein
LNDRISQGKRAKTDEIEALTEVTEREAMIKIAEKGALKRITEIEVRIEDTIAIVRVIVEVMFVKAIRRKAKARPPVTIHKKTTFYVLLQ